MRKHFTLLYVTFSVMSFAQYTDNVFDQNKAVTGESTSLNRSTQAEENSGVFTPNEGDQSSSLGVPGPGEHEEAPGEPVPIDDYIPLLLIAGLFCDYVQKYS